MDIKSFIEMVKSMPSRQSILIRGRHGIGKSQLVKQLGKHFAAELGLDNISITGPGGFVIDRRLAQMSEGDMIGLPDLKDGVTRFAPPSWYMEAVKEPRILFLDEV